MTEENYRYRTSPLFLRNSLYGIGKYDMPCIPKANLSVLTDSDIRMIGFDKIKSDQGRHSERIVHFFLYDYKFESMWKSPEKFISYLEKYCAVLTPDFSMYIEMHPLQQLYNVFRNRWCGAYCASKGLNVIPAVNWGLENTFDFCFEGIERGSAVAVSTYMYQAYNGKAAQKEVFMTGYKEMLKRLRPEVIYCYHTPFDEMEGNVVYIDYDLSSWRHL